MPNNLTDNEIKKALECCIELFYENNVRCDQTIEHLADDVKSIFADLINRLQAENVSQRIMIKRFEASVSDYKKSYIEQKSEIKRLLQKLQQPQVEAENKNIVHCKECKHLMFSDFEGECSKGYKGIVRPNDSCPFGVRERGESK